MLLLKIQLRLPQPQGRATGRSTAGGGRAGLPQARGEDRRAQRPLAGLRRAYGHRAQEVQRGPGAGLRGGRVRGDVRGREDASRICDITAYELARTHVSYYNDDAKRTKGMYRQRIQKAWGHTAARLLLNRARGLIIHDPAHRGANDAAIPTDEGDQDGLFFFNHPEKGATPLPRQAQPLLLLFTSNPPLRRGAKKLGVR